MSHREPEESSKTLQSIRLLVDGEELPMQVPVADEPYYRRAQRTISSLVSKYRARYELPPDRSSLHWLMAAVAIAVRYERLQEEGQVALYRKAVSALNQELEGYLTGEEDAEDSPLGDIH